MATKPMDAGLGTFAWYLNSTGGFTGTASLLLVLLQTLEAGGDNSLQSRLTLQAVLTASGTTESAFTNYARISVTTGVAVSTASHVTTLTMPNQTWANAGGATNQAILKLLACYKPSSGATDSQIIPMAEYDFVITTDGSNLTATVNASGLITATAV
jgi:hypothetical protein